MPCFKPAWDKGFTRERNLKGWRMEGLIPFNRNALWNKRGDLLRDSTGFNKVSSTTPSNQSNLVVDPPVVAPHVAIPLEAAPMAFAPQAGAAPDPTHEDEDLPPVLGHVTDRVQEAIDYVNTKHEIGQLTLEQLLAHLIKLQESSIVVTEIAAARAENPKANKQRIAAKNLLGNRGSATEPETKRMLAVKHA